VQSYRAAEWRDPRISSLLLPLSFPLPHTGSRRFRAKLRRPSKRNPALPRHLRVAPRRLGASRPHPPTALRRRSHRDRLAPLHPPPRVHHLPATLIGSCGGLRWPEDHEAAEIGYAIIPEFRLRGYALEANKAMLTWIEATGSAKTIFAHAVPHLTGSIRILDQCGFILQGPGKEENTICYGRN
jgi:hypothetical protein